MPGPGLFGAEFGQFCTIFRASGPGFGSFRWFWTRIWAHLEVLDLDLGLLGGSGPGFGPCGRFLARIWALLEILDPYLGPLGGSGSEFGPFWTILRGSGPGLGLDLAWALWGVLGLDLGTLGGLLGVDLGPLEVSMAGIWALSGVLGLYLVV